MAERDRPAAYDPSAEGEAMLRAERARWLTVAEAQSVRDAWERTKQAIDDMAETFDKNPEDAIGGMMFIGLALLTVSSFGEQTSESTQKLRPLLEDLRPRGDRHAG